MGNVSYSAHISNGKSAITSKSKLLGVAKHNLRKYKSPEYSSDNILLLRGTLISKWVYNHHFHYKENRVPTVRESARIQSFPDKFEFIGIKTSQLKQVGNAVPPLMAEAIAKQVIEVIERR